MYYRKYMNSKYICLHSIYILIATINTYIFTLLLLGESSPRSQQTLSNAVSLQDTSSMMQLLKSQMLRVMGDKLVNSLRQSNITSIDQVRKLCMELYYIFVICTYISS